MDEETQKAEIPQMLDLTAIELDQMFGLFISLLSAKAWQYMGLRLTPGKDVTQKDLVKAASAIDCIGFIVKKLEPFIPEEESSRFNSLLADLQINYARQSTK
jgi:hypothetical protein